MIGTEKQIKWAEDIKSAFDAALTREVVRANENVSDGYMPSEWATTVNDVVVMLRDAVTTETGDQAKLWIEHRDRILGTAKHIREWAREGDVTGENYKKWIESEKRMEAAEAKRVQASRERQRTGKEHIPVLHLR